MATDASLGYLTTWKMNGTLVGELGDVTPPESTSERVDVTHMTSPGRRLEFIAGMIDGGEASAEINWVPGSTTDSMIRDFQTSGETVTHIITFPNAVTLTFDGPIIGFSKAVPVKDKMSATVTVAVSGDEAWA